VWTLEKVNTQSELKPNYIRLNLPLRIVVGAFFLAGSFKFGVVIRVRMGEKTIPIVATNQSQNSTQSLRINAEIKR